MGSWLGLGGAACIVLAVLGGLIVAVGGWFMFTYNGLVQLRNAVKNAWSQIDVQLKRRYDLIPNLVETVKGYAGHEKDTLERVIQARQAGIAASTVKDQAAAENMITGALRQIFALSEAYPNLKANENFGQLQEELSSTENRISFARQHYNSSSADYNTACQKFPNNVIAGMFNFRPQEYFKIEDAAEKAAPQVKF
jgi:LemA protein